MEKEGVLALAPRIQYENEGKGEDGEETAKKLAREGTVQREHFDWLCLCLM